LGDASLESAYGWVDACVACDIDTLRTIVNTQTRDGAAEDTGRRGCGALRIDAGGDATELVVGSGRGGGARGGGAGCLTKLVQRSARAHAKRAYVCGLTVDARGLQDSGIRAATREATRWGAVCGVPLLRKAEVSDALISEGLVDAHLTGWTLRVRNARFAEACGLLHDGAASVVEGVADEVFAGALAAG